MYRPGKGWIVDNDHILMDRLMGYDESESDDSPYKIGRMDMLLRIKKITNEEAENLIKEQENH